MSSLNSSPVIEYWGHQLVTSHSGDALINREEHKQNCHLWGKRRSTNDNIRTIKKKEKKRFKHLKPRTWHFFPLSNTTFVFNGIVRPKLTFPTFATRPWCCWRISVVRLQRGRDLYLMEAFPDRERVYLLLELLFKLVYKCIFAEKNAWCLSFWDKQGRQRHCFVYLSWFFF